MVKLQCLAKNLKLSGYNNFIWSCAKYFDKEDPIYSLIEFKKRYFDYTKISLMPSYKIKSGDKFLKAYNRVVR